MNEIMCLFKTRKKDWSEEANKILTEILNIHDVNLNIVENVTLVDKFSTDDFEVKAFLVGYSPNQFIMYVRPGCMSNIILCHEMIHLDQYHRGDLIMKENGKIYEWKGVDYDKTVPYHDRPWEIEAFAGEMGLLKQYKKLNKRYY